MAITLVASISAGSAAGNDITSGAIDLSAANFIAAWLAWKAIGSGNDNITDSQGNTYVRQTPSSNGSDISLRHDYVASPSVSASHTVTGDVTPTGTSIPSVGMAGFSGVHATPADGENGSNGTTNSINTGSVTPSQNGSLIIASVGVDRDPVSVGVNNGFTLFAVNSGSVAFSSGNHQAIHVAYLIQAVAASVSCTFALGTFANVAARISVYKPAAVAAIVARSIQARQAVKRASTY